MPAALGFVFAAFIVMTAFYCSRHLRKKNAKNHNERTAYQPKRRPVRSPSSQPGQPTHYLKKSPSPTTITKPLPGCETNAFPSHAFGITSTTTSNGTSHALQPKYTEESETQLKNSSKACIESDLIDSSKCSDISDITDSQDYGKLGSLVFKLRYLNESSALVVSVIRCRGLPYKNSADNYSNNAHTKTNTSTDPYVKLQLLPDKHHKVKTRYYEISLYRHYCANFF